MKRSNLLNFTFSSMVIINCILFLIFVPALILVPQASAIPSPKNYVLLFGVIILGVSLFGSYKAYYQGIHIDDLEGRITRYGPISAGDKEFFLFMSKPIAFLIQLLALLFQFFMLKEIYGF